MKLNKIELEITVDMPTNEVKDATFTEVVNGEYIFSNFAQSLQLAFSLMKAMKDNASENPYVREYSERNSLFYDDDETTTGVRLVFSSDLGIKNFLDNYSSLIICE